MDPNGTISRNLRRAPFSRKQGRRPSLNRSLPTAADTSSAGPPSMADAPVIHLHLRCEAWRCSPAIMTATGASGPDDFAMQPMPTEPPNRRMRWAERLTSSSFTAQASPPGSYSQLAAAVMAATRRTPRLPARPAARSGSGLQPREPAGPQQHHRDLWWKRPGRLDRQGGALQPGDGCARERHRGVHHHRGQPELHRQARQGLQVPRRHRGQGEELRRRVELRRLRPQRAVLGLLHGADRGLRRPEVRRRAEQGEAEGRQAHRSEGRR